MTISSGVAAPPVAGVDLDGPRAIWFFKVACPTCQMAAGPMSVLADAFPGRVIGVGQDGPDELVAFAGTYGMTMPAVSDVAPYPASVAYGVEHVPTLFVVDAGGVVADVVESWDRDGLNRAAGALAAMLEQPAVTVSSAGDGLPDFRPG